MENPSRSPEVSLDRTWNMYGMSVEKTLSLGSEDRDALWGMLQAGFVDLNAASYEKQDMTKDEFDADLDAENVYKYIARDDEHQPIGLLMVHAGLENITWADMEEQRQLQLDTDPNATSYYVGTMVVSVDKRASRTVYSLIQAAFLDFKQHNAAFDQRALTFFDCAEANHPGLANLIRKACRSSREFPGVDVEVRELYTETILPDETGGTYKVRERPDEQNDNALDRQHYYVAML